MTRRPNAVLVILALAGMVIAAVIGAYLDWMWWPVYAGVVITIAAIGILLVGAVLAAIPRRLARGGGFVVLAIGVGLLAGQNLGPAREPLVLHHDGTITLHLESPFVATASAKATCNNVESGTEFQVSGDPNMSIDRPEPAFVSIYLDAGDRWQAENPEPRSSGVFLSVTISPKGNPDLGAPTAIGMAADDSSNVDAKLANDGGTVRFSGLVPQTGQDLSGEALDLAGTIEWVCGPAFDDGS